VRRKLKRRQAQHKQGAALMDGDQQRSLQGHDVHRHQQRLDGTRRTFALEPPQRTVRRTEPSATPSGR
jgi:hypothetical protein